MYQVYFNIINSICNNNHNNKIVFDKNIFFTPNNNQTFSK